MSDVPMSDVLVSVRGSAGRITLNRPEALNALTLAMVHEIGRALAAFTADDRVRLVVIDALGGRAFCAGGDIVTLYRTGRTDPALGRTFWRDEYRLNARIARFAKPVVTIMDGIVMGGGVGLSSHASHRVVTERSVVAMPEVTIGFSPDVGGTLLLARAPGRVGEYLAATGAKMSGADAIFAGFADQFVRSERLPALIAALEAEGDAAAIARLAEPPPESGLAAHQGEIDAAFSVASPAELLAQLQASDFGRETAAAIARNAPFSMAAALHAVRQARLHPDIEKCLAMEYRFSHRSLDSHDLYEGIRAAVIDKDRAPKWRPSTLREVDMAAVAAAFEPLGVDEWTA